MRSKTIQCSGTSRLRIRTWKYGPRSAQIDAQSDWGFWANATPKKLRRIAKACEAAADEIEAENA